MQMNDTPGRALGLLDRAVLMRLDPDPLVAITPDSLTDEPVLVGALGLDADLYVDMLSELERSASILGVLGWDRECHSPVGHCQIPHDNFTLFQLMLGDAADMRMDGRLAEAAAQLDRLVDGEAFRTVHRSVASLARRSSRAICTSTGVPES